MKTYTLTVSTNPWQAQRNPIFRNRETTATLLSDSTLEEALSLLESIVADYNDDTVYYEIELDMIRPIVEEQFSLTGISYSEANVNSYYNSTKKRWAILLSETLKHFKGAGYYTDGKLLYKQAQTRVDLDGYCYSID